VISFRCGRCAEWVRAGDQQAGGAVTCPRCRHVNVCPVSSPVRTAQPALATRHDPSSLGGFVWTTIGAVALAAVGWGVWAAFGQSHARAAATAAADPVEARQQEILRQDIDRPGDPILDGLFQTINAGHFSGALPPIPVFWEPRLNEVGALAARTFTLEGMFGHIGRRTAILLNTGLQSDSRALARALCHEMVHAYLFTTGDTTTNHGPAFQAVLRRLSDEGAFEGIVATDADRANLRAWLDAESERLDAERGEMNRVGGDVERERAEIERALADLNARVTTANAQGSGWPSASEVEAVTARRNGYNQNASDANARAVRDQADLDEFNRQVARYNLMLSYPDGLDEESLVKPKAGAPRPGGR